jgi:uncharacterized protein (TIGR02757 family)
VTADAGDAAARWRLGTCAGAAALDDPIELARRHADPADREVAAFLAASLAFGRVASVLQSVGRVLAALGPSPAAGVRAFDPASDGARLHSLVHRWCRGADLVALIGILRRMLDSAGSIEQFFAAGDDASAADVGPGLESFCRRALSLDCGPASATPPARPGVAYFFPRPSRGSACKRLNLFLRWMVRRDEVDFGLWTRIAPARLVVPLDVHLARVGRCLGLTRRRSPGWRMAAEITESLRRFDPDDPVKYDFALCHLGMQGLCGFGTPAGDARCPLRGHCRPRRR